MVKASQNLSYQFMNDNTKIICAGDPDINKAIPLLTQFPSILRFRRFIMLSKHVVMEGSKYGFSCGLRYIIIVKSHWRTFWISAEK